MKLPVFVSVLMAGILVSGCTSPKQKTSTSVPKGSTLIITPDASLVAKVISFNEAGRFVVLNFPVGQMPVMGQNLFLYRGGLKSGEVKVTGPQSDNNIVADIVTGDAQVGDEVRDQ
jgi:hypothetical protein